NRPAAAKAVAVVAVDTAASLESRVAAIFTYKQMEGARANAGLIRLATDPAVREWALRALTDRKTQLAGVSKDLFVSALKDKNPRVQLAAAVSLGRLGDVSAAKDLLAATVASSSEESALEAPKPPVFQSKIISKKETVTIDVDVSRFKELYLMVADGGNGTSTDHAAWFDPVFVDATGRKVKLQSLKWKSAKSGWGRIGFGVSATGTALKSHDGKSSPTGLGTHADSLIIYDVPKGAVRFQATGGLASTSQRGTVQFIVNDSRPAISAGGMGKEGEHATPNPEILLSHLAVKALVDLKATDACLSAVNTDYGKGALWALRLMHDPKGVQGLMDRYSSAATNGARLGILTALLRLYHKELPYDGSWWWGTRPDTHGPYYKYDTWEESEKIKLFVHETFRSGDLALRSAIVRAVSKHRVGFKGINDTVAAKSPIKPADPTVDLASIAAKKGQIGKMSIEDVLLILKRAKGGVAKGKEVFASQGCIVCHTTEKGQPLKGPFMGQVGAVLSPEQIAESILKPNASISQGFATVQVTTRDKKAYVGFVTAQSAQAIEIRNIAGKATRIKVDNIKERKELEISMMPAGLADALSIEEFASLVAFLASQKG
ncbi:MAG: NPCBM/NEW2 domain-containing protein, partial [Roseibacillus sp.]|nr:NPCBM/NEW2 domain-containing protein [Roseibacillus sp.]